MWIRLLILLLAATLSACASQSPMRTTAEQDASVVEVGPQEIELDEVQEYFLEIALRSEFGDSEELVRRWERPVRLFIDADEPVELIKEAHAVIDELQQLVPKLDLQWVDDTKDANVRIFFGPYKQYAEKYAPKARNLLRRNWGFFSVRSYANARGIKNASMYVDTYRAKGERQRKHLLREELTQLFGLMADSSRYPDSIFYQHWTTTTEYSDLDRALIKMLYDDNIQSGMDEQAVRSAWLEQDAGEIGAVKKRRAMRYLEMANER